MDTKDILRSTQHRSFPLPDGPWIMTQVWNALLFAHWPVAPEVLRPLVPAALPLDTFDGQCWVGIVPFYMTHLTPRGVPPVPLLSQSAEFNVCTYVVVNGIPGVYFFSLDAENVLAVLFARMFFHLPYFWATMEVKRKGDTVDYRTRRMHPGSPPAAFLGSYRPLSPIFEAKPGSLEYWLVERYCLYTVVSRNEVFRADIQHRPWPLQTAELEIRHNSMASLRGMVQLLACDVQDAVMLMERLKPGTSLRTVEDDEAAISAAAQVMRKIWHPLPEQHYPFPTVVDWFKGFARLRRRYDGGTGPIPAGIFDKAEKLYAELCASMAEPVLLHGDLHQDNILAAEREPWLAVDPKGVIGEPAYETGALLHNFWPDILSVSNPKSLMARRIDQLSAELGFERECIYNWGFAQAVLSVIWGVEDTGKLQNEGLYFVELLDAIKVS